MTANQFSPFVIPEFKDEREAAAWMMRVGKLLLDSNVPISQFISRRDNNRTFEIGHELQRIARNIATEYEFIDGPMTDAMYKAHTRATRQLKATKARKS